MNLYFSGTMVKVSIDGETDPIWVKYHGPHKAENGHQFENADRKYLFVPFKHPSAYIEWQMPTGWFNHKKSAIFCERIPKRQYLKGLSKNANFRMLSAEQICQELGLFATTDNDLSMALKMVLYEGNVLFNITSIDSIFAKPIYPSFEDAYILLKSKKVFARALTSELSLVPHPAAKDFIVLCHNVPVAELVTKNKVKMFLPQFKPECLSYFQKEGVSVVS